MEKIARRLAASLLLSTPIAATAGCGPTFGWPPSPSVWVDLDSVGYAVVPTKEPALVARVQAALDFGCDVEGVAARPLRGDGVYRVEGCGRVATYVAARETGYTDREPGHAGTFVGVSLRRFFLVSDGDVAPAIAQVGEAARQLGLIVPGTMDRPVVVGDALREKLMPWIDLSHAAARDLSCPRGRIVLDVVQHPRAPPTLLAEGCGLRGTFVTTSAGTLVITSRVSLSPGPARDP